MEWNTVVIQLHSPLKITNSKLKTTEKIFSPRPRVLILFDVWIFDRSKIRSFLFFLHSVCIFEFRRDGMFFLLTISDQVIQVSDIFSEHIVWTVEIFFESTFPTLKRSEWIQFWNFVSSDLLWRKKKLMLSSRLVLRDMCYCVHIHAKWLPTSSSKSTQGIP